MTFITKMNPACFDWLTWRAGSILEIFNIKHRFSPISMNKNIIRKYAIGYCNGEYLLCRSKAGYIAVMFEKDFIQWWTHFTIREFNECFPDI